MTTIIILSSIAFAYKEEIKQVSEEAIQEYIIEKINYLGEDQQREFNEFKELSIEDKLLRSWELNNADSTEQGIK